MLTRVCLNSSQFGTTPISLTDEDGTQSLMPARPQPHLPFSTPPFHQHQLQLLQGSPSQGLPPQMAVEAIWKSRVKPGVVMHTSHPRAFRGAVKLIVLVLVMFCQQNTLGQPDPSMAKLYCLLIRKTSNTGNSVLL